MQSILNGGVNNALLSNFLAHVVIDNLGIVLSTNTSQALCFCLWNAQTIKGIPNILRYVVPAICLLSFWRDIRGDMVQIQTCNRRSPVGSHLALVIGFQGRQPHLEHPLGLFFFLGNSTHNFWRKAIIVALVTLFGLGEVVERAVYVSDLRSLLLAH